MGSAEKKQRKHEEKISLKRKKLMEEHDSTLSEEEDIPQETSNKKRKEQNAWEETIPEASPLLTKKKEREKRRKEKEPIGSIAEGQNVLEKIIPEAAPLPAAKKEREKRKKKKKKPIGSITEELNVLEEIIPEAAPVLATRKQRKKRSKKKKEATGSIANKQNVLEETIPESLSNNKEREKTKKKEKKPIGSIAEEPNEDGPQLDESAHAHRKPIKYVSFRLLVPSTDIGKVIGPHGSRIHQLREDTGALIKIGDAIMNLSERLVWISSKEDSLKSQSAAERALLRVAILLMEPCSEEEEIAKLRLLIAGSQADSMVDGAEVVMRKISENTGAMATILKKRMFPLLAFASDTDRLVMLEGQVSEVLKALELIAIRLRERPPKTLTGGNGRKNGGAFKARVEIRIPDDSTGKLIGKKGATIQQLQQQCGVSLEVGEPVEGGKYRIVHLRGMLSQVTMAQTLLQVFLASKQKAR